MDSYVDLTILRDPEFPASQLMGALYAKLHRALVAASADNIAVAFPNMDAKQLGETLRLIGPREALSDLMGKSWMQGMRDHTEVGRLTAVPSEAVARTLRRVQAKSSPQRLLRRTIKRLCAREGITEEAAMARVSSGPTEKLDLPYLHVRSASTAQSFRLFLKLGTECPKQGGRFNAYGLSADATIPWF
jgi:CRISPR-associated endonuclease Csy4